MSETITQTTTPQVDPTSSSAIIPEHILSEVSGDIDLGKQVAVLLAKGDKVGALELLFKNRDKLEEQTKEVVAAIPLIKAGYKTTEFWIVVAYFGLNLFCILKGIQIPMTDDASLGGVVLSYVAGRHYIKSKQ